jgi:class 3 adenylate cyclase
VAELGAAARAKLPDSAFAYVDSRGRRRLPINDESHVRNALSRFNQVAFEDDEARDRARTRLLKAAKKYRIVPVGFIDGQLRAERGVAVELPSGFVTMLMTDIEGSTALVHQLGDRYAQLITTVRRTLSDAVVGGCVVEARADEFFAAFVQPAAAVTSALAVQRDLRQRTWPDGLDVRVRIGIHSGYPTLTDGNYIGMAVHVAARICEAAHGGQIVVSGDCRTALAGTTVAGVRFAGLGGHRLRGIPDQVSLYQVVAPGLDRRFPPLRVSGR